MVKYTYLFEWDLIKDQQNQQKHGVAFSEARKAFYDQNRVLSKDISHSIIEERFYCYGKVNNEILTVRFTLRNNNIRIIGAGYWREGRKNIEKRIHYTNAPADIAKSIENSQIISDFLPPPEALVKKQNVIKVTLSLTSNTVSFFKSAAAKNNVPYQTMIRNLLEDYSQRYSAK